MYTAHHYHFKWSHALLHLKHSSQLEHAETDCVERKQTMLRTYRNGLVWCIGTYLYFDCFLQSTATVITIATVAVTTARSTTTAATITVTLTSVSESVGRSEGRSVDGSVGRSVEGLWEQQEQYRQHSVWQLKCPYTTAHK